ncbi:uncharacterized protein BO95DRAFT_405844 [Aspergillus brunneoviolaceus CBS 621.78]|uniref:Uncharacterized protein n=1 Tax=Aspergillus brunneoviolaceus CBS 621.78 TaxID=1450534 RepID=A0ACD1GKB0_9EURO|nr:hypothetical protein BO95DRAFT_405844 [Aspergillus brunneoviolaceus CBS 621.78]RAH49597.1 hypothetical protein BO95DRAFT_405844 [Aspergillus brunneoviolaceus CBS 621.78]
MARQRKAHTKSRDGCLQCKERHIRRLDLSCSFSAPTLATMPLNQESLADLELLDFWYRHPLLPGPPDQDRELKQSYAQLGFSHPYLLNSILALVSLRRFGEGRARPCWYSRALAHQQAAISRARPHFQHLDGDSTSHKAMLAFSTFTSLYAVVEPLHRPTGLSQACAFNPVDEFLHAVWLGRRTTAFVQQHLRAVAFSDPFMAAKYSSNDRQIGRCDLEAQFPQLRILRDAIRGGFDEGEQRAICLDAVERIFACMRILVDDSRDNGPCIMVIFTWVNEVDRRFLDLCVARQPVALVILAHFAALMSLNNGFWLLQHWPGVLLEYIQELLKDWGGHLLQWPREVIFR